MDAKTDCRGLHWYAAAGNGWACRWCGEPWHAPAWHRRLASAFRRRLRPVLAAGRG